jgi:hypothetical protein
MLPVPEPGRWEQTSRPHGSHQVGLPVPTLAAELREDKRIPARCLDTRPTYDEQAAFPNTPGTTQNAA